MKRIVFLMIVFSVASIFAGDVYFYRNGEKITMTEQKSVFKDGKARNAYTNLSGAKFFISGNIFVKLETANKTEAKKWCGEHSLNLLKQYKFISHWYLASFDGDVFEKSAELVENGDAVQAEPSFYFPVQLRAAIPDDTYFSNLWHIRNETGSGVSGTDNAHVAEAWEILIKTKDSMGGGIKLAIIDDGFDLTHEDLSGRFLSGWDFNDNDSDPSPGSGDAHGTCCAGVAGASVNNGKGVAGACPDCSLIPIRMNMNSYSLDSIAIESFEWAADNGADIISNSWGPQDNAGSVDMGQTLKDLVTTLSTTGRNGKGIIILFAAGNGNESIETDGFASNSNVFAIGATNAAGSRCSYSDYGNSLDFMTPSGDISGYGYTDGIYTTDNTTGGYVTSGWGSELQGNDAGTYTYEFAGTSSSCPLGAGITGLVLAANPNLTRDQVYDIFKETSDKVGGVSYDSNGFNTYYGYGRLNACEAVRKALEIGGTDISNLLCSSDPVDMDDIEYEGVPDDTVSDADSSVADENSQNDNELNDNSVADNESSDDSVNDNGGDISDNANADDSDDTAYDDTENVYRKSDNGCSCSFIRI